MGTNKRLKDQQDKLKTAEDAVPGAYESRYTGQVDDYLSQMGQANDAGFDYDTTNEAYQQYKARTAQNAQDAAAAATNTAQGLAGGYGADWASSAANQAAAGQTAAAGTSLADLRSQALQQWQNELSGENNLVDTLLGQDSQERITANMNTGAAQSWRDYLASRVNQERQENSDFWSNVWNGAVNVGNAIMTGYDSWQGYSQQKLAQQAAGYQLAMEAYDAGDEERARQILKMYKLDESQVDVWKENYATQQAKRENTVTGLNQAFALLKSGAKDAATEVLNQYGIDTSILDSWDGLTDVQKEQLEYIVQAMAADSQYGNDTGVQSFLKAAGIDTGSIDYYSTTTKRQNDGAMDLYDRQAATDLKNNKALIDYQAKYRTTSGGGSGGSSGGGSGSSGSSGNTQQTYNTHGYSNAQLLQMSKTFQSMSKSDPQYAYYKQVLTDAGYLPADATAGSGSSGGTMTRQQVAANAAQGQQAKGADKQTIYNSLRLQRYSEDEIAYAMGTLK